MRPFNSVSVRSARILGGAAFWVCALLVCFSIVSNGATLPAGFTETQIGGLSNPTAMSFAPDGRLFICQQGGALRIVKNGVLLTTAFLTLTVDSSGERGLLGVAFDPNFAANRFIYLYYTVPAPAGGSAHNRLSRFTASTANPDVVQSGSEFVLIDLNNLSDATNHNGGAIHFGPDGKIYLAVGENANSANSQTLTNLLGKVLRLNSDGSIPNDNPFFNTATGNNRAIWALGLRNPFTFGFQPGTTRLFINDVGQNTWEEINDGIAGSNYGWPTCEGLCSPPNANFRDPVYFYNHTSGTPTGCAIVGAAFYNPATAQFPATYAGKYFFADLCGNYIRYVDPATTPIPSSTSFATGLSSPVDLQVAADGALWYLQRGDNSVYRIQYPPGQIAPAISQSPTDQTVLAGQTATFTVAASGAPMLNYQWQKNTVDIAGANSASYTTPAVTFTDNGDHYHCVVTNAFGSATSNDAKLSVVPNAGDVLISEFRLRGPGGAQDEYVELYNNTNSAITVVSIDGSSGWAVAASDGIARFLVPNGSMIPPRGHFLGVNSAGYSLGGYPNGNTPLFVDPAKVQGRPATQRADSPVALGIPLTSKTTFKLNGPTASGDAIFTTDIADNAGIALFNTSNPANFTLTNRLDAVGSASEANTLYKEGTGYPALAGAGYLSGLNYAFVRDLCGKGGSITAGGGCSTGGLPKDTNNNATDFVYVDPGGNDSGAGQRLGAPGPENLTAPIQRNSLFGVLLLNAAVGSAVAPNRTRSLTPGPGATSTFGTLDIRRRFVNNTGGNVTRLRFRIIDLTTFSAPGGWADLRPLTSADTDISNINDPGTCGALPTPCTVTVFGTTLEQPAAQPNGGGFNSSLSAGTVTLGTPLANGASINLRFVLGVQQTGTFRFIINVEALP